MSFSKNRQDSRRNDKEPKIHKPEKKKRKVKPEDFGFDDRKDLKDYERFLR